MTVHRSRTGHYFELRFFSLERGAKGDSISLKKSKCHFSFHKHFNIGPVDLIERAFGLRDQDVEEKTTKLHNYVNFCIRHVVYRNRNRTLGFSLSSTVDNVCNKIRTFIQNDLIQKYDRSKAMNKVDSFEEAFLIGSVLGKIEDHELTLTDLT